MTVNLAWRDAMAEIGGAFNKTEVSAGWAESFTTWQIAMLQRPWRKGDREGKLACHALFTTLGEACKAGELAHRTLTVDVQVSVLAQAVRSRSWVTDWEGRESEGARRDRLWRIANPQPTTKTEQREQIRITAEAFAAWLAANELEPSRHVTMWFKAMGVNTDRRPIEPPAGWKAQSPHGLQRIDNTDAGRLVRLADLVQWLMDTEELPCKAAVEAVCSVLEQRSSAAAGWLYLLTEADYARPLAGDDSFSWWPGDLNFPKDSTPANCGIAGAIKYMRQYWGESPAAGADKWNGQHVLEPLAVRLNVAHLLWGYGRRVEVAEQTQAAAPAEPVTPSPTKETTARRNARWLGVVDEEERTGSKIGAQARAIRRIVADESEGEHKVKKGIQAARAERAKKYREGGVTTKSRKKSKPATPFDGLRKRT